MTPAELTRALRDELRGFPPDKVDEFLNTVLVLRMAPTGEAALLRQREKLDALERVERSAEAFLDSIGAMPLLDEGLFARDAVKLAEAIHQADLRSLVEAWCLKHQVEPTQEEKAVQLLWLKFQEARTTINAAIKAGVEPEEYRREDPFMTARFQAIEAVRTFRGYLQLKRDALAAPRPGPRSADHRQVLTEVARAYWRILGRKPTATADTKKPGSFYNLARIVTGLEDPSRAVEQAITVVVKGRISPESL